MSDNTITIKNLTKKYKIYNSQKNKLIEVMLPNQIRHSEKTVINDISLEVKKGEIIGILGKNGAGKSTLLKMITGVLTPTSGTIEIDGKISSLLELGTAFNMELTGIENIYLHGQINGMTRNEIDKQLDDIINFADIGEFINQPVKTYSSGMFARLAFSSAIHIDPEILLVDEVLSVGDMRFQEKSIEKMKKMVKSGCTVLFVSHSLPAIRQFCNRAIWLENGSIKMDGNIRDVTEQYEQYMKENEIKNIKNEVVENNSEELKSKTIYIKSAKTNLYTYFTGEDIQLNIKLKHNVKNTEYGVGVIIRNEKAEIVSILNLAREEKYFYNNEENIELKIINNRFGEGKYFITVSICDKDILYSYDLQENICSFVIELEKNSKGTNTSDGIYICEHEWIAK